eukprot:GHVQ01036814.1.p2 GENE.GHVQ01036814.1~~GHVQ01036814.1.p2  ORF type:complete len:100 (+),score=0.20 GHVQ01036814.1:943-1242(+)
MYSNIYEAAYTVSHKVAKDEDKRHIPQKGRDPCTSFWDEYVRLAFNNLSFEVIGKYCIQTYGIPMGSLRTRSSKTHRSGKRGKKRSPTGPSLYLLRQIP